MQQGGRSVGASCLLVHCCTLRGLIGSGRHTFDVDPSDWVLLRLVDAQLDRIALITVFATLLEWDKLPVDDN